MPRVKLPNGQTASFPENMSLQEIQSAIESDPNSGALPGVPKAPIPAGLQGPPAPPADPWYRASPQTPARQAGSLDDTIRNVGSHLANMVTGPFKAAFAPPADPTEAGISQAATSTVGSAAVPAALGAYRAFVKPSQQAVQSLIEQAKKGNYFSKDEYDAQGNYTPSAFSSLVDAAPLVGPWARNIETEAQQKGAIPALAGMGTDILGPKVIGKVGGLGMRGAGLGARFAAATPEARTVAQTRALVPGEPAQLLARALKPSVANPDFEGQATRSLPEIVKQNPAPGVKGFGAAANTAKAEENAWYQGALDPHRQNPVSFEPAVQAQIASVPTIAALENPNLIGNTSAVANRYLPEPPSTVTTTSPFVDQFGRPMQTTTEIPGEPPRTLGLADTLRRESNQRLHSLYEKTGGDKYAALANPETVRTSELADSMRDITYGGLSEASGIPESTIRARQSLYGDLSDISDVANKRGIVFGRQNPYSLQESIAMSGGGPIRTPLAYLGQRMLKKVTDSDALTNAALDRFKSRSTPTLQPRQGFFPQTTSAVGRALSGAGPMVGRMPLKYNPFAIYAAANPPRR